MTRTILVVEDDESIRELLETLFETRGFAVLSARDGADAIEVATAAGVRPNVIALDLNMPVMDGLGFLAAQPDVPLLAHVPVIVLSARPRADQLRDLPSNVRGVVEKPMDLHELVALATKISDAPARHAALAGGSDTLYVFVKAAARARPRHRTPTQPLQIHSARTGEARPVLVEQAEALLAARPAVFRAAAAAVALPGGDATPAALSDEQLRDLLAAADDVAPRHG